MELRQLKYFVTVAEEGSFSRASQTLFVAQSALSHQVAALEKELGALLLHRIPRGVSLTEAGHIFLAHAITILRQADEARASVLDQLGVPKGKVNIGLPPSICSALAVPLIKATLEQLPGVELELTEAASGNLTYQLKSGLVHLAVLFDDGDIDQFETVPMLRERLYLIAKENEENRKFSAEVALEHALQLPLFLASAKQGVRRIVERAARQHGLPPPNVVSEINSVSILRSTLLVGLGYTLLPPMPFKSELDAGHLRGWPICQPTLSRQVLIATIKGVPLTPATKAVHELVLKVTAELRGTIKWAESAPPSGL